MMVTRENDSEKGRDTGLCGDPKTCCEGKRWYPMRVTYSRELKVKGELDRLGIENFVPMTYKLVDAESENPRRELVPAVNNLIFVRSTRERLSSLKMTNAVLEPLRYMMDHTSDRVHEMMTVGDREMENFMRVAAMTDDSVMFLDEQSVVGKEGKRVMIMGGAFAGVEGVIRRVKRCKRVVVELEGIVSVAIAYVPPVLLKEIKPFSCHPLCMSQIPSS